MFNKLFGGGEKRAGSPRPDGSRQTAATSPKQDAHQLLSLATDQLQRLRVMQPTDPEAFPLLNEASRCGESSRQQVLRCPSACCAKTRLATNHQPSCVSACHGTPALPAQIFRPQHALCDQSCLHLDDPPCCMTPPAVQQLEADVALRHGTDEYPLWRL